MRVREVCRAGAVTALLFGCGPSTELLDVRRQTVEAAERFQSEIEVEGQRVAEAVAAATEASHVADQARYRLNGVQNEAGSGGSATESQALRDSAVADRAVEQAIAAVDRTIEQCRASQREVLGPWRDLYTRCVALEADEGESGGCGPIPP